MAIGYSSFGRANQDRRRVGDARVVGMPLVGEKTLHALHVGASLRVGRNALVAIDRGLAGIVRGDGERDPSAVVGEQPAKIGKAALQIVLDVEAIPDVESRCGRGDQLHHAARVLVRARVGLEVRLGRDDRQRESRIDAVLRRGLDHQLGDPALVRRQIGVGEGVERLGRLDWPPSGAGSGARHQHALRIDRPGRRRRISASRAPAGGLPARRARKRMRPAHRRAATPRPLAYIHPRLNMRADVAAARRFAIQRRQPCADPSARPRRARTPAPARPGSPARRRARQRRPPAPAPARRARAARRARRTPAPADARPLRQCREHRVFLPARAVGTPSAVRFVPRQRFAQARVQSSASARSRTRSIALPMSACECRTSPARKSSWTGAAMRKPGWRSATRSRNAA